MEVVKTLELSTLLKQMVEGTGQLDRYENVTVFNDGKLHLIFDVSDFMEDVDEEPLIIIKESKDGTTETK